MSPNLCLRIMWLVVLSALSVAGQDAINVAPGSGTASLAGTWRWKAGDDVRWAAPDFDDSSWAPLLVPGPPPLLIGLQWIRIHVKLSAVSDPGLMLGPIASDYEVYWDGVRIGKYGEILPVVKYQDPGWQVFRIPPMLATPGVHTIAIRAWSTTAMSGGARRARRFAAADNRIGGMSALREADALIAATSLTSRLGQLCSAIALLLGGLYFLLMAPSIAQGNPFRLMGAFLLVRGVIDSIEVYNAAGPAGGLSSGWSVVTITIYSLLFPLYIEFGYALFRRSVPVFARCIQFITILQFLSVFPIFPPAMGAASLWLMFRSFFIYPLFPVYVAWGEMRKGTAGARLALVLSSALPVVYLLITLQVSGVPVRSGINFAGTGIGGIDLALFLWIPGISMLIHQSNQRLRDERERMRGEMDAARRVQELLLPSRMFDIPGFQVEAAYRPANEVGGDFYQLFATPDGGLLIVVGDVSGKGLQAALLVSLAVGALQHRRTNRPAEVLAELNTAVMGHSEGGFTTCCCALFAPDDTLTIANAGHLPPYINNKEIHLEPGLPLGIVQGSSWNETIVDFNRTDRIVFVSDGVVEARNRKGELLGFDRTEALAARSPSEIVRAAQDFGQDDDITVVAVRRMPAGHVA